MTVKPRPKEKFLGGRAKLCTPWNFNLSVFESYKPDNAAHLAKCFELDWSRMRIPRGIKQDDAQNLKDYMREKYKWFRETYKYLAGVDP